MTSSARLVRNLADAAAAIILTGGNSYLLQQRDATPSIPFPDHWGFFGGAAKSGEDETATLVRELDEELGLAFAPSEFTYFTRFTFDLGFAAAGTIKRAFYTIRLTDERKNRIRLGEGRQFRSFAAEQALGRIPMTPYDAFALWLHASSVGPGAGY